MHSSPVLGATGAHVDLGDSMGLNDTAATEDSPKASIVAEMGVLRSRVYMLEQTVTDLKFQLLELRNSDEHIRHREDLERAAGVSPDPYSNSISSLREQPLHPYYNALRRPVPYPVTSYHHEGGAKSSTHQHSGPHQHHHHPRAMPAAAASRSVSHSSLPGLNSSFVGDDHGHDPHAGSMPVEPSVLAHGAPLAPVIPPLNTSLLRQVENHSPTAIPAEVPRRGTGSGMISPRAIFAGDQGDNMSDLHHPDSSELRAEINRTHEDVMIRAHSPRPTILATHKDTTVDEQGGQGIKITQTIATASSSSLPSGSHHPYTNPQASDTPAARVVTLSATSAASPPVITTTPSRLRHGADASHNTTASATTTTTTTTTTTGRRSSGPGSSGRHVRAVQCATAATGARTPAHERTGAETHSRPEGYTSQFKASQSFSGPSGDASASNTGRKSWQGVTGPGVATVGNHGWNHGTIAPWPATSRDPSPLTAPLPFAAPTVPPPPPPGPPGPSDYGLGIPNAGSRSGGHRHHHHHHHHGSHHHGSHSHGHHHGSSRASTGGRKSR